MLTQEQIESNKNIISHTLKSTRRAGVDNVLRYLDESGFYLVPSSIHRHHNWKGGLAEHSLGVYHNALLLAGDSLPKDSVAIVALLHDICKASKLYYDNEGRIHHRHTHIHGHGYRSVKLLQLLKLELSHEERNAIRWHMGGHHASTDQLNSVNEARESLLWKVIHKADKMDAAASGLNK